MQDAGGRGLGNEWTEPTLSSATGQCFDGCPQAQARTGWVRKATGGSCWLRQTTDTSTREGWPWPGLQTSDGVVVGGLWLALWSGSVGGMGVSLFTGFSGKDLSGEFVTPHCHGCKSPSAQIQIWGVNQESPLLTTSGAMAAVVWVHTSDGT